MGSSSPASRSGRPHSNSASSPPSTSCTAPISRTSEPQSAADKNRPTRQAPRDAVPSRLQAGRAKHPSSRRAPDPENFEQRRGASGAAENEAHHVHALPPPSGLLAWLVSHEVKLVMDPRRGRRALDRPGARGGQCTDPSGIRRFSRKSLA
jgi:hypothetical protein